MNDPIVDEVRSDRRRLYEACDREIETMIHRLREAEGKDAERLVNYEDVQGQAAAAPDP